MKPVLFIMKLPFTDLTISIYSYESLYIIGIMVGTLLGINEAKKKMVNTSTYIDVTVITVISGFIGSRLFYILQHFNYFYKNPAQIIRLWEGGYVFYGAFIGGFAGLMFCLWKFVSITGGQHCYCNCWNNYFIY